MNRRKVMTATAAAASGLIVGAQSALPSTKPDKLKYLQIGIGHAHANKILQYSASESWDVIGIVEENPELRERAQKTKPYQDYRLLSLEEGLNTPGLAAVGIETEIRDLLHYADIAIDAGFHIHLDKPAGTNFDRYKKLLRKADQKSLISQMGYMYRFNPAILLLHDLIDAGALGDIFETHAVMSKVISPASRQTLDEFAGGTMFELGGHIIDLTIGVLGKPETITPFPRRVIDNPNDTLVDNMLAVFGYPRATATIRSTGVEVEGFSRRHFAVCGTSGTVHIQPLDRPTVKVSLAKAMKLGGRVFEKGHTEIEFGGYQRYAGDVEDFAQTIRGEKENSYPSAHDLAVQQALLAASAM
ncbi:MAG: Gfo/Idh/MocA family oxidoreductase [Planctomycetota bacterium]